MTMQLARTVFVGSGIFELRRPDVLAKESRGLGEAVVGIDVEDVPEPHRLAERGW